MKKLIIAGALALAGLANAGTLAVIANQSGTGINLTDSTSERCQQISTQYGDTWFYAYVTTASGEALHGCWWSGGEDDDKVQVRWANGKTYFYNKSAGTLTRYGEQGIERNKRARGQSL